jgi:hypothetical protein
VVPRSEYAQCIGPLHRTLFFRGLTVSSFAFLKCCAFLKCFALTADTVVFLGVWIGICAVAAVSSMQRLRMATNANFVLHVILPPSVGEHKDTAQSGISPKWFDLAVVSLRAFGFPRRTRRRSRLAAVVEKKKRPPKTQGPSRSPVVTNPRPLRRPA